MTQRSIDAARLALTRSQSTDAIAWRAVIESTLSTALSEMDSEGLAETVQFMTHFFDADGRLDEAIREVDHAIELAAGLPAAEGLLQSLRASFLTAIGSDREAAEALAISEQLLVESASVPTTKWPVMAETVRLKLLLGPSVRLAGLLSLGSVSETQADYLVLLSWYIPYLAAIGDRQSARPLVRLGRAAAGNLEHRWRISDMEAFERWQATVDGTLPIEPPGRAASAQAAWRQATLWLWSVSLRRDLRAVPGALEGVRAAHARQGKADAGPLEAWEAWTRALVGDRVGVSGLHPPQHVNLSSLGSWLLAAHCVAIAGTRDDARIWLPWIRKLEASGVESSIEWPVSRKRIEGLLWLRSGKKARARVVLRRSATWAREAGYATEAAVSALAAAEATRLLEAGGAPLPEDALDGYRATLLLLGIDPLFDMQGVQSAALAGTQQQEPILTAREVEVLRLLAEDLTYREIGEALGISWQTVRTMAHSVYEKLGAKGKHAAAVTGRELGLL